MLIVNFLKRNPGVNLGQLWDKSHDGETLLQHLEHQARCGAKEYPTTRQVVGILVEFAEEVFDFLARPSRELRVAQIATEAKAALLAFAAGAENWDELEELGRSLFSENRTTPKGSSIHEALAAVGALLVCASSAEDAFHLWSPNGSGGRPPSLASDSVMNFRLHSFREEADWAGKVIRDSSRAAEEVRLVVRHHFFNRFLGAVRRLKGELAEIIREHFPASMLPVEDAARAWNPPKPQQTSEPPQGGIKMVRVWAFYHDPDLLNHGRTVTFAMANPRIQSDRSLETSPNLQRATLTDDVRDIPGVRIVLERSVPRRARKEWDFQLMLRKCPHALMLEAYEVAAYEVPLHLVSGWGCRDDR